MKEYTIQDLINEPYNEEFKKIAGTSYDDIFKALLTKTVSLTNKNIELEERVKELDRRTSIDPKTMEAINNFNRGNK
jgi:hypothetical protein